MHSDAAPDPAAPLPPLKPRQAAALALLLSGATDTDVAATLGIGRRTLYTWRHSNGPFAQHLRAATESLLGETTGQLTARLRPALDQIAGHLQHPDPLVAHRAAATLLRHSNISRYLLP